MKAEVASRLGALTPSITLQHSICNRYHDRFWITSTRSEGLVVGTSLNGLGKRYALVDKLAADDVHSIVSSLSQEGVI